MAFDNARIVLEAISAANEKCPAGSTSVMLKFVEVQSNGFAARTQEIGKV
jgi:hypothetical protein